jgi:hypothetical protein
MSAKGGITKGKSHKEGGIPMVVKSTGQQVELEGGEGVINKRNMSSEKKFEFEGQEKTICEIASEINSADGNGVQIDCDNVTGTKYEYATGGKILDEEQESSFKEWMEDGNVIEWEKGVYSTQDAQYSNRIKGMDELRKYFRKEFLSDSYEGGGSIDVETYDYNQLIGKYVNIHSMGVELPSEHKVEGVMFSSPQFRYRQLTLKFDRGIAPIEIEDIPKFLNNDIVFVNDNKEDFGVQLIPNQFAEGGGVENMPKSYQVKRTRELSIINEYLTKAGGEPMTEQDVESVLNHYNPTYFYEIESEVFSLSGADEENLKVIEKRRLGEAFMFFKRKPKMAEGGGVSSLGHYTAVANLGTRKIKENLDNFQEAQEFMDRMAEKNAISVEMTKINQEGKRQTIFYEFDGENWVIKNKSDIYANGGEVEENNYRISISENDKYIGEYPNPIATITDAKTIFVQLANKYKRPQYLISVFRRPTASSGYEKINVNEWYDYVEGFANGGDVRNMSWFQDFKKQELKRGTEHEMEHIDTIREFKKEGVSDREVAEAIAKDHLDEDENYYIELSEMEKESKNLDDTLYEYEKNKSHRKNAHKYAQGGYMGDARVKVHLMFTEDFTGILRKPNGSYLTESFFPKNKVSTFNFIHNDGRTTALEFSNTGAYMLVPSDIINVVGFDEQFANGGSVSPYQSVATDDNDKLILNKLRTIDDIYSVTSKEKQLLSSFKGDNVVNQLSNAMIQKIYSVLFKYHNIEHPIKNLYLSNIGVGNILLFAPNYIDHTICSYDKDNRFSEIEEEISSIVTLGKRASILTSEVELHNIDAIIHVYAQTNPISDSLVPLLFKINKTGGTALGVAEFTSREKLNQFQKTIAQNQGGMGLNQMMMFKKSNDYLIVNEGITEEGNYTLMYVMNKM